MSASVYWPPMPHSDNLIRAALRVIEADHYASESDPHRDAKQEYAAEGLALAARELVRAVDALPAAQQPIGWNPAPDVDPEQHNTVVAERAAAAVERVRELHRKASHGDDCVYCVRGNGGAYDVTWPCDTIRALAETPLLQT